MFFCLKRCEFINKESIKKFYKKFGIKVEIEINSLNINIKVLSGYSGNDISSFNINIETLNAENKMEILKYLTEKNNLHTNSRMNKKLTNSLNKCNYQGSIDVFDEKKQLSVYIFCLYLCKKGGIVIGTFENEENRENFMYNKGYFMNGYDENIILNRIYIALKKNRDTKINLRYVWRSYIRQFPELLVYLIRNPVTDIYNTKFDIRLFVIINNRKGIVSVFRYNFNNFNYIIFNFSFDVTYSNKLKN